MLFAKQNKAAEDRELPGCLSAARLCLPPQACSKVCTYVSRQVEHVRKSMDGKNVDTVLTELGVRFHRLIHEHLQQYSYSSMGGMLAICDVAEYRRCAKDFRVSGRDRGGSSQRTKRVVTK